MKIPVIAIAIICCLYCCQEPQIGSQAIPIETAIKFKEVSSEYSNLDFANELIDYGHLNPFTWNFIYQGAGVGVGDFDNDGLVDIYLAGNQVSDKIYRNTGDLKFEDKTANAGIEDKLWSTGVSVVDINADGLLDVYVCKHSFAPASISKKNKLYINQGNFNFKEAADEYGLGDTGFSVQAIFVDVDNDEDLDCYLVNQRIDNYTKILFPNYQPSLEDQQDRLFINTNGRYTSSNKLGDVRDLSYGLNPSSADFDNNGFVDLHISTDYDNTDALFMNYGGLDLKDEAADRFDHTAYFSMGSDIADVNNDGHCDLYCVDMAYNSHVKSKENMASMNVEEYNALVKATNQRQYMNNVLQINDGSGRFREIAHAAGIQSTDWSWGPLFVDFDQDGMKDIVVSNGIPKDIRNNDLREYGINVLGGQVTPDNYKLLYQRLTSSPVANMVFKNEGEYAFSEVSEQAGFTTKGFSTGIAYADLDNDGDLDLVFNNTSAKVGLFENVSTKGNYIIVNAEGPKQNESGLGKSVTVFSNNHKETYPIQAVRGYMSSSQAIAHFGLPDNSKIDSIQIRWNAKEKTVMYNPRINSIHKLDYDKRRLIQDVKPSKTMFVNVKKDLPYHIENEFDDYTDQVLLPHSVSQHGPRIAVGDINQDGMSDIFLGSSIGQYSKLLIQESNESFKEYTVQGSLDREDGEAVFRRENGSLALYVCHGSGQYSYSDARHGVSRVVTVKSGFRYEDVGIQKGDYHTMSINDNQLWVFGRVEANQYPSKCLAHLYEDKGDGNWRLKQTLPLGMVSDAEHVDIDEDGDMDVIVVGEWMPLTLLENQNQTYKVKVIEDRGRPTTGWWSSVGVGDFNKDGKLDIVAGNLGKNNKFKPSIEKPFYIFSNDFDRDGSNDVVLAKLENQTMVPIRGKECSSQELDFINDRYKDYRSYATASLNQIFGDQNLRESNSDTIYSFTSKVFYQETVGFSSHDLPIEAQFGPIQDLIVDDFDGDGNLDMLYTGNQYGVEVETVRYDAGRGGLLIGDGQGSFRQLQASQSGLRFRGDFRDLDTLTIANQSYLLASQNSGQLEMYELTSN